MVPIERPDALPMVNLRLLVVSLGNPGSRYRETYHSAGHLALRSVQQALGASQQSHFGAERYGGKACEVSRGAYTMVQSPVLMNVSGPWVLAAYKETLAKQNLTPDQLGLVLVHDELEQKFGVVKTRKWAASHRGHNGVKSSINSLKPANFPHRLWARVAVGIGRPDERDRGTVADYVLQKMHGSELNTIHSEVGTRVIDALIGLQTGWESGTNETA